MISEFFEGLDKFQESAFGVAGNTLGGLETVQSRLNALLGTDQPAGPQPEKVSDDGEPASTAPAGTSAGVPPWVWVSLAAAAVVLVVVVARRAG